MEAPAKCRTNRAFSLAEVLLALGLIAVAVLALLAQDTYLLGSNQKLDDTTIASDVASGVLDRVTQQITRDEPPGKRKDAWLHNDPVTPSDSGSERIDTTEYSYKVYIVDVLNTVNGEILGSGASGTENPNTRLKKIKIVVTWWDQAGGSQAALGNLTFEQSKLLKVTSIAP